jgi:hypothetical protein
MKCAKGESRVLMRDNYHGFEGAPPTGSRVTIDFSLVMVPAASSLSEGRKSGGGGHS